MIFGKNSFSNINFLLNEKFEKEKHLIAVHRGSFAGNIIQNTIPAYMAAFQMGADIIECDINRTIDGILFSFHDGYEKDIFHIDKNIKNMTSQEVESYYPFNNIGFQNKNHINRLSEILQWLPQNKFLNIDRAWDIFPYLLEELDKYEKIIKQVIIKSPVRGEHCGVALKDAISYLQKHNRKYMYMPICHNLEDVEIAMSLNDINIVGCELIAEKEDDELFDEKTISFLHENNLFIWVNAINLGDYSKSSLCGMMDDDISIINSPKLGWGKLIDKKIDIIQTDWPAILHSYLNIKNEKIRKDKV